jgi:hypothetical protein
MKSWGNKLEIKSRTKEGSNWTPCPILSPTIIRPNKAKFLTKLSSSIEVWVNSLTNGDGD